jgi:ABC-2 type transport system permease protein
MMDLSNMIWTEARKAIRSRMPLWTALGSLFMPLGIAFLILVSRNPEVSQKLGLISAKANLIAYAGIDWPAYLAFYGQLIGAGGFILFILTISWVFGREFVDGTLKDMLAVPVRRFSIVLAKFVVVVIWSLGLSLLILLFGLLIGAAIRLPGGSPLALMQGALLLLVTACLVIISILPFAFFASVGRGYLLPVGVAILTLMMTNLVAIAGWGEYFPWAVPVFYAQGKITLGPVSYVNVILTGLLGILVTYLWWKYADQNR